MFHSLESEIETGILYKYLLCCQQYNDSSQKNQFLELLFKKMYFLDLPSKSVGEIHNGHFEFGCIYV